MKYQLYCKKLNRSFNYSIYCNNIKREGDKLDFSSTLTERDKTPIESLKTTRFIYKLWSKKFTERLEIRPYED